MAQTTIVGALGKDPEMKTSRDGQTSWAQMSLAWSERSKDKTGQWVDGPTVWVQVKVFRRQGQNIEQSLHKGDRVVAVGDLRPEEWSSQQGPETVMSMVADVVAPELTFASVDVVKNPKGSGAGTGQQGGGSSWDAAPQGGGFDGQAEQPPF